MEIALPMMQMSFARSQDQFPVRLHLGALVARSYDKRAIPLDSAYHWTQAQIYRKNVECPLERLFTRFF
jgi:hypothetical protein